MSVTRTSDQEESLSCPVCMETFTDPRELPCLHTFCLACLHSSIMSANSEASAGMEGFHCPVCRAYTIAPLHGLYPYSWAENYPPNYALRALLKDTSSVKQKAKVKHESGGKSKLRSESKEKPVAKTENGRQTCELHQTLLCVACTNGHQNNRESGKSTTTERNGDTENIKQPSQKAATKATKPHRSLSRLSRSGHSVEEEVSVPPQIDPDVLTYEFANARMINSQVSNIDLPESHDAKITSPVPQKMLLKRLCGSIEKRRSFEKISPPPFNLGDVMPGPVADYRIHRPVRSHSYGDVEQELSDDFKEFLQMTLPQKDRHHNNPVGHLNDIKEEDEESRQCEGKQTVTRLHEKVYVRAHSDERCCFITGITVLSDSRVLISDENNKNIKLYSSDGNYIHHISFTSEPFDIDKMGINEAVVSFPNEKCLRILHIDDCDSITVTNMIQTERKCRGVACHRREVFVALESEVRVFNYNGKTLNRFQRDPSKRKIFSTRKSLFVDACYLAVDDQYIHVSDMTKRCVVTLNRKGEAISTFKDGGSVKMLGLSTGPTGKVSVCRWPDSLLLLTMSEHGFNIRKILTVDNIQAVTLDPKTLELWVSQATNNFINLFRFKQGSFT